MLPNYPDYEKHRHSEASDESENARPLFALVKPFVFLVERRVTVVKLLFGDEPVTKIVRKVSVKTTFNAAF